MNLTRDKERMFEWAKREYDPKMAELVFLKSDVSRSSYYEKRDGDGLIYEYGFETFAELRTQIEVMWSNEAAMQECIRISSVATMKCKPDAETSDTEYIGSLQNELYEIPEYVYVF